MVTPVSRRGEWGQTSADPIAAGMMAFSFFKLFNKYRIGK